MRTPRLVALVLAAVLLSGCAVRTQFQGCLIRCPDMTKDPDQLEAEGERAARNRARLRGPSHTLGAAGACGGGAMTQRLLTMIGGLALLGLASACQWPTQPTPPTPPCVVVGSGSGTPTPVTVNIDHCGPAKHPQ